jgi:hypothetical protein
MAAKKRSQPSSARQPPSNSNKRARIPPPPNPTAEQGLGDSQLRSSSMVSESLALQSVSTAQAHHRAAVLFAKDDLRIVCAHCCFLISEGRCSH